MGTLEAGMHMHTEVWSSRVPAGIILHPIAASELFGTERRRLNTLYFMERRRRNEKKRARITSES